jgi:hypothetical protein
LRHEGGELAAPANCGGALPAQEHPYDRRIRLPTFVGTEVCFVDRCQQLAAL